MTNHLADERSRYLQQHADNPVDWYPWGEAAFEKARREDKPIFLSIGYSACHWCHVMAHESFEDDETAALLNAYFVSIKVDREERPDVDRIYMGAVQALTGRGGWPMSVFITAEGEPFYGGTYFPPDPRPGLPAFKQILLMIADAWESHREELLKNAEQLVAAIHQQQATLAQDTAAPLSAETLAAAYGGIQQRFDWQHGGWGNAPKFPQPMAIEFLLRRHYATGDERALQMVTHALEAMARGGIYDQIGGGFHRYAVDARWQTPHFEKMLYDSALLVPVYLHAWQVTGAPLFRAIVEETLDYIIREMTNPSGGFYATQDADTEGQEGKFFLWTPDEIHAVLGRDAKRFMEHYGVTARGNFEGQNILTFHGSFEQRAALAHAREQLFEARERRTPPGRDEKVLTSWNGLMLAAFAEAARVLDRPDYRQTATRNADFLLTTLHSSEGRLWHTWIEGEVKVKGLLVDYAYLIAGLLALYQTTFAPQWITAAEQLAATMMTYFAAEVGFYDTPSDAGERIVVRPRETQDSATPSGNAMAATVLLKLARFGGERASEYEAHARRSLAAIQPLARQHPLGFAQWLIAIDAALAASTEIAIAGDLRAEATRDLIAVAQAGYHPQRLVATGQGEPPPLLAHRTPLDDREDTPAAYVCHAAACRPPVTEPDALRKVLVDVK
ncbi:MAG: thioredoxin domain-containing protein [Anaerolineales bacterium]